MRYERKYHIGRFEYADVRSAIFSASNAFKVAYPKRTINSIYFDSITFDALHDNLDGVSHRSKVRIRWYGDQHLKALSPVLEFKIKKNMLGMKKYESLSDFTLDRKGIEQLLNLDTIKVHNLKPVVLVKYEREYFESFDRKVRITLDKNIEYFGVNELFIDAYSTKDSGLVLECKYDQGMDSEIDDIFQSIPFRVTKNSKFVNAVESYWF